MKKVNLRDLYPDVYKNDHFVEVTEDVLETIRDSERAEAGVTLECTECKQRNYNMTKDKKTHPERMETKKYCKFCKTHTLHKETK